jgi:predicted enzyme related to lactoylglutathione lyase
VPAKFCHFAINADDVPRARRFYEAVFGWTFDPWGPPGFYQIKNAGAGVLGALQGRRELVPGVRMAGYEATLGVEDLKATIAAVEAGGGRIIMPPYRIDGVGELIFFEDTEGNLVGAMQYEARDVPKDGDPAPAKA